MSEYILHSQSDQAGISQDLMHSDQDCVCVCVWVYVASVCKFLYLIMCLAAYVSTHSLHTVIDRKQGLHPPSLQHVGELHVDGLHGPSVA